MRGFHPEMVVRPQIGRAAGLDLLRLLAMAIVVVQHGLSVVGHYDWTQLTADGLTIGQFGVGIFCALSGWFALADRTPPGVWLLARLERLYPAYWLATLLAFSLALLMHRPVTPLLFLSQMAGTGFFTHGWELVNVVSWFISLIVLCYALAAVARLCRQPRLIMSCFCIASALLVVSHGEVALSRHVVTFAAAAIAGAGKRPALLLLMAAVLAPLLAWQSSFIFAILALLALWGFLRLGKLDAPLLTLAAGSCYEFFLLHGIVLNGAARLTSSPLLVIVIGSLCTMPAALLLRRAVATLKPAIAYIGLRAVQ